ncbi:MAG: hypothetical protein MZV70_70950 [Desulfobacterales bacterium]|nr:hypothetical protein [Desulfobacterales bacterium]
MVFDFAEEVQFKASGYNAEYGGSVGGVVNVITRSGGNAFHGELVGYYSGTALEGQRRDRLSLDLERRRSGPLLPLRRVRRQGHGTRLRSRLPPRRLRRQGPPLVLRSLHARHLPAEPGHGHGHPGRHGRQRLR